MVGRARCVNRPVRLLVRSPVSRTGKRGSLPLRAAALGQVVEWQTRGPQKAVPTGREGSTPSLATDPFRGRLTVGQRALNPPMLVRTQPPDLCALVVKGTSWLPPKEQVQVRVLAGVFFKNPAAIVSLCTPNWPMPTVARFFHE